MRTKAELASAFDPTDSLRADRPFLLVGIGGAGMSGLARMLTSRGLTVRGTDAGESASTRALRNEGIDVRIGHAEDSVAKDDQLVFSDAIALRDSLEYAAAGRLGRPVFRRSQLLGWLLRRHRIIAVTGTHGKTTTTAMIGAVLRAAGLEPTIVVGAEVPEFGGSVVEGKGDWAVVEACEAYQSYLDIDAEIAVLTNVEADHLDHHETFKGLVESLRAFAKRTLARGWLVYCEQDPGAASIAAGLKSERTAGYGRAPVELRLAGEHNALNAGAALRVAQILGLDLQVAERAVAGFAGAERRLQVLRERPIAVVDDYAHHPTEVRESLRALREMFPGRRLIVVFQPHLYSRTAEHLAGFADSLSMANHVVLTDIYPAREDPIPGISSARIAELITAPCDYVPSRHLLHRHAAKIAREGDVVVGMGAGSIADFAPLLLNELDRSGPTRVAVVYGGDSAEREISLLSGCQVHAALKARGCDVWLVDVTDLLLSKGDVAQFLCSKRPDVAFLCVHGTNAEDGAIQGFFELMHLPYTGSGIQASALAMDKQRTKEILALHGLPTPSGVLIWSAGESIPLAPPLVVKPNAQGSTVGVTFVRERSELSRAVERALRFGSGALVEEWIEGIEISVPVLGERVLPVVEIVPKMGVYDFANKYVPGATDEIVPARLGPELTRIAQDFALRTHRALGCSGATRTDMMVRDDEVFVLEINTIPGMTGTSLLPNSARAAGMSFEELCEWMVQDALSRHAEKT